MFFYGFYLFYGFFIDYLWSYFMIICSDFNFVKVEKWTKNGCLIVFFDYCNIFFTFVIC